MLAGVLGGCDEDDHHDDHRDGHHAGGRCALFRESRNPMTQRSPPSSWTQGLRVIVSSSRGILAATDVDSYHILIEESLT